MFYIFFKDTGDLSATCDSQVNVEDLEAHGMVVVESNQSFNRPIYSNGKIKEKAYSLDEQRDFKWMDVKTHRDDVNAGGVKVDDTWFQTDSASVEKYKLYSSLSDKDLQGVDWYAYDDKVVPLSKNLVLRVLQRIAVNEAKNFGNAKRHKEALYQSETPSEYDYSTGWTMCYADELAFRSNPKGSYEDFVKSFA